MILLRPQSVGLYSGGIALLGKFDKTKDPAKPATGAKNFTSKLRFEKVQITIECGQPAERLKFPCVVQEIRHGIASLSSLRISSENNLPWSGG